MQERLLLLQAGLKVLILVAWVYWTDSKRKRLKLNLTDLNQIYSLPGLL